MYFIHVTFQKKTPEETCNVGPGNNYFLGYGLWFSLATATGLLLLEICAADYKSQTALWLTALVTVTEPWKKNKHKKNVKDLECKITNLRRRGAVRSARFSSVDLKVGPVVSLRAAQQTALGSSVFIWVFSLYLCTVWGGKVELSFISKCEHNFSHLND